MTPEGEPKEGPVMRCRMRFGRPGDAASLSHLEQIKDLRAMVTGSGLEYYGSRGPAAGMPKMAFGPAAGAGHGSLYEYADAWFARRYSEEELRTVFHSTAGGLKLSALRRVPLLFPSIEASAEAARYEVKFASAPPSPERKLSDFMSVREFWAEREKGGEKVRFDLRPSVLSAGWDQSRLTLGTMMRLRGGGRPEALAAAIFGAETPVFTAARLELYWKDSAGRLKEILNSQEDLKIS